VRNERLEAREIEFLRWRADRWMKLRHFWPVLAHDPLFVLRHGPAMLAHTFRGSTVRSALGLESERAVFERYQRIRRAERDYLPDSRDGGGGGAEVATGTALRATALPRR
jgi:anaerobic magnesium-protoporphyrin IX monomethyl ester cyclase